MKFENAVLVVKDMERSKAFYRNILGLRVTMDLGANVTLTGGVALQTLESWSEFIHTGSESISFGGRNAELYFEEEQFDAFLEKLTVQPVEYVHPVQEHSWGQRVVRFFDPDWHVIEVGEPIRCVCRRFLEQGMTAEDVAKRMDVPLRIVRASMR